MPARGTPAAIAASARVTRNSAIAPTPIAYAAVARLLRREPEVGDDEPGACAGDDGRHVRVAEPGVVVHEVGAGGERGRGDLGAVGVDRDHRVGLRA